MDTTSTNPAMIFRDIHDLFTKLGEDSPSNSNVELLKAFHMVQEDELAIAQANFNELRSEWSKEWLKLSKMLRAKNRPAPSAIAEQHRIEDYHHQNFYGARAEFLIARAREEVTRMLPSIFDDELGRPADAHRARVFSARAIRRAWLYLDLN